MKTWVLLAPLLLLGCLKPVCDEADKVCLYPTSDGGFEECLEYPTAPEQRVCVSVAERFCGGKACAAGEFCCVATARCVTDRSQCVAPQDGGCASNEDCAPNEACLAAPTAIACVGLGVCMPRNNCGFCTPAGSARCQQCGCDGRTYASLQEACVAGVRIASAGPCGGVKNETQNIPDASVPRFSCGRDEQCPDGKKCCSLVGECFDPAESWRCEEASDGGVLDCLQDNECAQLYVTRFCDGAGCSGPGRCRHANLECGGEVVQVCGCNGTTYTNACWASGAAVRVAHSGSCP